MQYILRVNMRELKASLEPVNPEYAHLGGRGLTSRIILQEVPAACEPLGAKNKLVIAPGVLAGTIATSTNRVSIGAKSPLTGGIKESNGGGVTAYHLARLNIRAIIIEEKPSVDDLYLLRVSAQGTEIIPATNHKSEGVYATAKALYHRFGKDVGLAAIGPAGELGLAAAGISNSDRDGNPTRYSARGGLGAVMGSKGLKAIIIDSSSSQLEIADEKELREAAKRLALALRENVTMAEVYPKYGTAVIVNMAQALGAIPTKNYSNGSFELADQISGEKMYETIVARGGEGNTTHGCMPGCVIRCSNVYPDASGKAIVSPIEYESIGLLGSNLSIGDLDTVAKLNYICNDLGLDTIETGGALGVAMAAGILKFGDGEAVINLLEEIRVGTPLGRLIGSGSTTVGKVLNVNCVPAVKWQNMAAYDPRAIKGMGVTYATSPMGADHTAGALLRAPKGVDPRLPEGQVIASLNAQIGAAIVDSMGLCLFIQGVVIPQPKLILDMIKAKLGLDLSEEELKEMGKRVLLDEIKFNQAAGFTTVDDDIPEYFREKKLPSTETVFDVVREELEGIFSQLTEPS